MVVPRGAVLCLSIACAELQQGQEDESSVEGRERFNLLINIGQEELLFARRESKLLNANYIA